MFYLLFIAYLLLFCWLISRIQFFKNSGLTSRMLICLFLIRIAMSLVTCYFNLYYFPNADSLAFHNGGIDEYNLLMKNPREFFFNFFQDGHYNGYSGFLDVTKSYWNDAKGNLLYKTFAILDIFSGKNFFVNTLLFNCLVFFGPVALYKVFIKIFPADSYKIICCVFLLPSALFFSSMMHRDGFTLLALSIVIYHFYFMINGTHFSWKKFMSIIFFMMVILILRSYVFIVLLPALLAWFLSRNKPKYRFLIFSGVYLTGLILFFCSGYLSPKTDLPYYVCERQQAFIEVAKMGASTIDIDPLYPNFKSFLLNAPQALNHALLRPYPTEIKSFVYVPFVIENIAFEILLVLFIFFRKKFRENDSLVYFCFFLPSTIFLITGYTVPIIGAIVRYRSIYLIFLLIPIVCYIDWKRISQILHIKNKNI